MADDVTKVVLLPRFSAFVSAGTFTTKPVPVGDYASAIITVWRGNALGTTPTFQVTVQQSLDLATWYDLTTISPGALAESTTSPPVALTMTWLRLAVTLGGGAPAVGCWAVGDFLKRAA